MASLRQDADKENVHRTRIPLPKDPLPALPKHLLVDKKRVQNQEIPQRRPLETLNTQSTNIPRAGPSKVVPLIPKHPLNIDTKHVTLKHTHEELDWHYTVFKEKRADKDASIISISDDDDVYLDDKGSQRYFVDNKKKNTLGVVSSAGTPNLKVNLEPNRVRNIKGSLERPHSRELQGLSTPAAVTPEKPDDKVKRRLKFNESIQDRLRTPDFWKSSYMRCFNWDYATDVFDYLLAKETKPLDIPRTSSIDRACVINWLMEVNGADGDPAIIQSACWYLDSYLGIGHVSFEKLQLIAAACFWIAQKLNGPVIPAMRLVELSDSAFTADRLLAAEKAVLIRLKFPQQPIVAQDYITYLSWWCDTDNAGAIEVAATFLAMCGLMVDRDLCNEYPSVIAVAAVRNALILLRKKELMPLLEMCKIFLIAEKKASNLPNICSFLCRAVRTVSAPCYEYNALLEHYDMPSSCVAQIIICGAHELSVMDDSNTEGR